MAINMTDPPTLPDLADPSTFNARALALFTWIKDNFIPELEAIDGPDLGGAVQTQGDVLDDLNTLGAATADDQFIVSTAAGVFAYQSGAVAAESMGLNTVLVTCTAGGTANALTLTSGRDIAALSAGMWFAAQISTTNTGAMTVAVDGLATVNVKTVTGEDPPAGHIRTTVPTLFFYDGTNMIAYRETVTDPELLPGYRNKIINGDFDIWQEGTSFSGVAAGDYHADQWRHNRNGSGATVDIHRTSFSPGQTSVPGNPKYKLRVDQTVAGSGATFSEIGQRIEGVQTLSGKTVTITFYAISNDGGSETLPYISVGQAFGSGGSPSSLAAANATTNVVVGTAWTKVQVTYDIPSISGKTLGTNGDDNLYIAVGLPVNSTFQIDFAHFSVVEGDASGEDDPFEPRHPQQELALCERYYQRVLVGGHVMVQSTTEIVISGGFQTEMLSAPSVTLLDTSIAITEGGIGGKTSSGSAIAASGTTKTGFQFVTINGFTGLTPGNAARLNNGASQILAFDARL